MPEPRKADIVLDTAKELINGDRQDHYGDVTENFKTIATLWGAYLKHNITSRDVANMMILVKVSRDSNKPIPDNMVDIAGYAALASEV